MSKRPGRPAGQSWLSPYLTVQDVDAALDFYQRAFGLEKRMSIPGPDGKAAHGEAYWQDIVVMVGRQGDCYPTKCPATSGTPSPVGLYLYCNDVDALFARATAAGAKVVKKPEDVFYGDRVCQVTDPDGYHWWFATNVADFDPSKMPH
jgi:PhnB protein